MDPLMNALYDVNQTCRACLKNDIILKSMMKGCLRDMFVKFTNLEVLEDDGLPSKLCSFCIDKLNSSLTFLESCIKSDTILKQHKVIKSEEVEITLESALNADICTQSDTDNLPEFNYILKDENDSSVENQVKKEQISFQAKENIEADADFMDTYEDVVEDYVEIKENIKHLERKRTESVNKNTFSDNRRRSREIQLSTSIETDFLKSELSDFNLSLICPECGERFLKSDRLEAHYRVHLGKKPEQCDICNREFTKLERLESHKKQHPKCKICDEIFATKSVLREHKKSHNKAKAKRMLMCHICGKSYERTLKIHMAQKHSDVKPFQCNLCPLAYKTIDMLKMHLVRHSGIRKYVCSVCGHGAFRRWELKRHMLTHNDEKPFACGLCPNRFRQKEHLTRHSTLHTGERPHQCDLCPMSFRDKKVLKHHRMLHTGEKPHVCSICNKAFTQKVALTTHMKVHK